MHARNRLPLAADHSLTSGVEICCLINCRNTEGAQNVATATSAAIGQKADGAATKATPSAAAVPSKAIPVTDRTGSKSGTGMAQASQSATGAAISQKADGTTKTTTPTSKVTTGASAAVTNAKKVGP
jgi:hypothetical protein